MAEDAGEEKKEDGGDDKKEDDKKKKKPERKPITEIRDSVGIIILRLILIQGIPITLLCICCRRMYKIHKKNNCGGDDHFHFHADGEVCPHHLQECGEEMC